MSAIVAMAARFQNIREANDIAFDVSVWMINGIPYSGLGGQVYHDGRVVFGKNFFNYGFISQISFDKNMLYRRAFGSFFN